MTIQNFNNLFNPFNNTIKIFYSTTPYRIELVKTFVNGVALSSTMGFFEFYTGREAEILPPYELAREDIYYLCYIKEEELCGKDARAFILGNKILFVFEKMCPPLEVVIPPSITKTIRAPNTGFGIYRSYHSLALENSGEYDYEGDEGLYMPAETGIEFKIVFPTAKRRRIKLKIESQIIRQLSVDSDKPNLHWWVEGWLPNVSGELWIWDLNKDKLIYHRQGLFWDKGKMIDKAEEEVIIDTNDNIVHLKIDLDYLIGNSGVVAFSSEGVHWVSLTHIYLVYTVISVDVVEG
jgi:hypothetical protein